MPYRVLLALTFFVTFAINVIGHKGLSNLSSVDPLYITVATFLFATLSGFFISRQSKRYSSIREEIARFSGELSSLYRLFAHFGEDAMQQAKHIIQSQLGGIVESQQWNYLIVHKSSLITDMHALIDTVGQPKGKKTLSPHLQGALSGMYSSLSSMQTQRKSFVSLSEERIPFSELLLIYLLAAILVITLFLSIDTGSLILSSFVKSSFITSVAAVLIVLHQLNSLQLFEKTIGMGAIQDVLDILDGKK